MTTIEYTISKLKRSNFAEIPDFSIFGSVSDSKTTVSGRVTGLLLGRLDRISIIFMKNFKKIETIFFVILRSLILGFGQPPSRLGECVTIDWHRSGQ